MTVLTRPAAAAGFADDHAAPAQTIAGLRAIGVWRGGLTRATWPDALRRVTRPIFAIQPPGAGDVLPAIGGGATLAPPQADAAGRAADCDADEVPLVAWAPAVTPAGLGDAAFRQKHGVRLAYVAGAMANGIASVELVEAMSRAGMLGFFGAAGLEPAEVEAAIGRLQRSLDTPFGVNLIHSPNEPRLEAAIVDLYLKHKVRLVSASAYLGLTLPLLRYRFSEIHRDANGRVIAPNHVVAKVSRVEVARKFFSPPPPEMLAELVRDGALTSAQAEMAASLPVAEDLTAEADSGGHTDNRPLVALLPTMLALRDELQAAYGYENALRVGAAGGMATPASVAAAFSMGAAYVLTGTINQACVEAGTSDAVRRMLCEAQQADVAMAPAADMFEMGVQVQVLRRGTMFAQRAKRLYELYRAYESLEAIPARERGAVERDMLRCSFDEAWRSTQGFFATRDPAQIERAERDPRHRMALVFRSYLGQSSNWANRGDDSRKIDYQVWCGPAMGAFNEWARGSCLEPAPNRNVVALAKNLMFGAATLTRASILTAQGIVLPPDARRFSPMATEEIDALTDDADQGQG